MIPNSRYRELVELSVEAHMNTADRIDEWVYRSGGNA